MSLFGSIMGDFEDDPFFGPHMQRMNNMMSSMFDPFGMMGSSMMPGQQQQQNRMLSVGGMGGMAGMGGMPGMPAIGGMGGMGAMGGMQMMPFGFPPMPMNIGAMFSNLENMSQNPNCQSFTSSSIMTMTTGPDGRPQVYQESMSSRSAPGGIRETKKSVSDSRSGTRKMAIGHHIGERAHIIEREQNMHSGDQEERQDYINLEEEEAEDFNREWENKTKRVMGAIGGPSHRIHGPYGQGHHDNRPLALPSTSPSSSWESNDQARPRITARRAMRPSHSSRTDNGSSRIDKSEVNEKDEITIVDESTISTTTSTAATRKREHSPEPEQCSPSKRLSSGSPRSN
ncbi:hypothetical protein QAD02_012011 [Eretmocerus hayati]|uniref:Uncharacterized protein n=1 Tax=Eretmocerus hayati TaxID=131215 RepID=A0ACC2NY53_9HYME|nr:hypothetical protein QAD02_012011 [Eretmocerus hayati]